MASTGAKTIALLAGLAAVVVAVAVGLNWREIYYAFRPEARFGGRWVIVKQRVNGQASQLVATVVEFRNDATAFAFPLDGPGFGNSGLLFDIGLKYRVSRERVVFSNIQNRPSTGSARYGFETDDRLILEWVHEPLLGDAKTLTMRRLPEHGDADD